MIYDIYNIAKILTPINDKKKDLLHLGWVYVYYKSSTNVLLNVLEKSLLYAVKYTLYN